MSLIKYEHILTVELHPSRNVLAVLSFICAGAMVILLTMDISAVFKIVVFVMVCFVYCRSLYVLGWIDADFCSKLFFTQPFVSQLQCLGGNQWLLGGNGREPVLVYLMPSSFLSLNLVVLNFQSQTEKHQYHMVITKDSLSTQEFRNLRVCLRTNSLAATGN